MFNPPSSPDRSSLVTTLRAAGCVFAEEEAHLLISEADSPDALDAMVARRVAGLPLEHVLGWAEFRGRRMTVDAGVFVPRRRTEFLVDQAIALVGRIGERSQADREGGILERSGTVMVDLCCGSGALGVALALALDGVELHAADIDPAAVRCARRNLAAVGGRAYEGDLYDPLPRALRGRVDILVANVPYVPTGEIELLPPEARIHEARVALDGGPDGLDVLRRVAAQAARWLAPAGHLLFETSRHQVAKAVETVTGAGLLPQVATCDDLDATVVTATRRAEEDTRDAHDQVPKR